MTAKLIIGLGNPGTKYTKTRHNVGFLAVDSLAKAHKLKFATDPQMASEMASGADFVLAKPQTFMNNSGVAAIKLAKKLGLKPADLLVIYDDVDLPVGSFRYRETGSSSGQKGMKSILDSFGTKDIPRIRIGVGKDKEQDTSDYVLAKLPPEDFAKVEEVIEEITKNIDQFI